LPGRSGKPSRLIGTPKLIILAHPCDFAPTGIQFSASSRGEVNLNQFKPERQKKTSGFHYLLLLLKLLTFSPITQADERMIFVGLSARMSERIRFLIREFRSSHKNWE